MGWVAGKTKKTCAIGVDFHPGHVCTFLPKPIVCHIVSQVVNGCSGLGHRHVAYSGNTIITIPSSQQEACYIDAKYMQHNSRQLPWAIFSFTFCAMGWWGGLSASLRQGRPPVWGGGRGPPQHLQPLVSPFTWTLGTKLASIHK